MLEHTIALLEVRDDGARAVAAGTATLFGADGRAGRALALEVRVLLPTVASMKEVELNVEAAHMTLTLGAGGRDTLSLPARCDPEGGVGAKSDRRRTATPRSRDAARYASAAAIPDYKY